MRVAVTGAAGFIGRHLVARLVAHGHRPRVLVHSRPVTGIEPDSLAPDSFETVRGGLEDRRALAELVSDAQAVIHCGGLVAARRPADFQRINVQGTAALARATQTAGTARFLLISSLAARAPHLSAYARSKADAEAALAACPGLAWDALRPPAVYGPGDPQTLTLFRLLKRGLCLVPAGPPGRLSLIHVADLVSACLAWLHGPAPAGLAFELGDGKQAGYEWREVMRLAGDALGTRPRAVTLPPALLMLGGGFAEGAARLVGRTPFLTAGKARELCHRDWVCRDDRLARRTGWRPERPLATALPETLAWYRAAGWL